VKKQELGQAKHFSESPSWVRNDRIRSLKEAATSKLIVHSSKVWEKKTSLNTCSRRYIDRECASFVNLHLILIQVSHVNIDPEQDGGGVVFIVSWRLHI
jgi:hypothetical protein